MRRPALVLLAAVLVAAIAPTTMGAPVGAPPAPPPSAAAPAPAHAERTLDDYRLFRALSIDLAGRAPTRAELDAFEAPAFDLDRWIDEHLAGPAYVERLERVYMDLLRLEVGPAFQVIPPATTLRRHIVTGPDKKPMNVYYRVNQRRERPETDGEFCLTQAETGLVFPNGQLPRGKAIPVKQKALDAATVRVRPWWLYKDYRAASPKARYGLDWGGEATGFGLFKDMVFEPDGTTPTTEVRVCREEAQTSDTGHVMLTARAAPPKGTPLPKDRWRFPLLDEPYARLHKGQAVSCRGMTGFGMAPDCGCGVGLEHCIPGDSFANEPVAFTLPSHAPLGAAAPFDALPQITSTWTKHWWAEEARRFMDRLFGEDRDFREALTARWSSVNGPLAAFYRSGARASCCARERAFKMVEESEPLFTPAAVPADLLPMEAARWERVDDRGPHAAGLLTMPVFLAKYASRRARGAAVYSAFLCKSFVADDHADLEPSTEPDLMKRPGCSTCHATLEPLAAYFARVEETGWVFLPSAQFPVENRVCKKNAQGKAQGFCDFFYDPAFGSKTAGKLRGAYASADHAERGPAGIAADVAAAPEFASCAVERVAASFLGRPLREDDQKLAGELRAAFVAQGYRMRALVGALVRSGAYRSANDDRSSVRRGEAP